MSLRAATWRDRSPDRMQKCSHGASELRSELSISRQKQEASQRDPSTLSRSLGLDAASSKVRKGFRSPSHEVMNARASLNSILRWPSSNGSVTESRWLCELQIAMSPKDGVLPSNAVGSQGTSRCVPSCCMIVAYQPNGSFPPIADICAAAKLT